MLKNADAECLIITAPTNFHKELAIKALENGLHVLVEKPLARIMKKAKALLKQQKGIKRN